MARDINQVFIIGRLVRDPEIRYTPSGTPVTKFSLANNTDFVQNNERKEYVNYFDVNVWGNQAVNCEKYLTKGKQVAVTGSLRQQRWNDKTSGQTRSKVEITATSVQFLSSAGQSGNQSGGYSADANSFQYQQNQAYQQPQQPKSQVNNGGFISDPWGDSGGTTNEASPFDNNLGDDDIPF